MAWARLDDVFPEHRKLNEYDGTLVEVGVSVVLTALQTRAICYCSRNRTDGHLPPGAVSTILADVPGTGWPERMVEAELWHRAASPCERCEKQMRLAQGSHSSRIEKRGFVVHDFLEYNPSKRDREKLVHQRRTAAKSRWKKKNEPMRDAEQVAMQTVSTPHSSRIRSRSPTPTKIKTEDLPPNTPPVSTGGKKRREWCPVCAKLLDLLNELSGKKFSGSEKALGYVHARHTERGVDACERVVRVKVWKWLGTKWEDFLRPETLFAPTKFDGYANETVPKATGRKFDPYSPADQEERAKLHEKVGVISPERRAEGVNFLNHQIGETEKKLDAATESADRDSLSKKLEDLRRELVFLTAVKGVE